MNRQADEIEKECKTGRGGRENDADRRREIGK
jgi:hypothetical protein